MIFPNLLNLLIATSTLDFCNLKNRALKVVEETEELLVVNKPSSLPIHPCGSYRSCLTKIWKKIHQESTIMKNVHVFFFSHLWGIQLGILQRLQFIDCDSAQSRNGRGSDDAKVHLRCAWEVTVL